MVNALINIDEQLFIVRFIAQYSVKKANCGH